MQPPLPHLLAVDHTFANGASTARKRARLGLNLGQRTVLNTAHNVCHDTLPYGPHPGYGPAVCRGFYNRYDTQALQLARRLWGIVEVPPPAAATTEPALTSAEAAEATRAVLLRQAPATGPKPLVFVDVDGVLNPDGSHQQALGYRPHRFDGIGPDGQPAGGIVWLHPDHGAWLAELEAAGGQPVWTTSWGSLANTWISPRLGLPGTWPIVDLEGRSGGAVGAGCQARPDHPLRRRRPVPAAGRPYVSCQVSQRRPGSRR
jgi:hypothetical protein